MNIIENEWGLPITALALLAIVAIFGTALWFIFSANRTNRKIRWLQIIGRREAGKSKEGRQDPGGPRSSRQT